MTDAPTGPALPFSIREIPFSYHGSWFDISPVIAEKTFADDLHLVSHKTGLHPILRFSPMNAGEPVQTTVEATPARLAWRGGNGRIDLCYEDADTIRLRGRGLGMRITAANPTLTPFSGTYLFRDPSDGSHVFTVYETGRRYRITQLAGAEAEAVGAQHLGTSERGLVLTDGGEWELAIEELDSARRPYLPSTDFDRIHEAAGESFAAFVNVVAPWRSEETPAAELAAYVLWSATVDPAGFVTRPAVLMSKHWMDKVWSWDHCFNALALASGAPELAWSQYKLVFDHQDEAGALPDSVTHSEVLYNFVKPPIHGWALRGLRERLPEPLSDDELAEVYQQLAGWTEFWLNSRRAPGHALAHYQHGNDSGWDNATTFDPRVVAETADLAAFLVQQMLTLADLATELGRPADADRWSGRAAQMRDAMLAELWTGEGFLAQAADSRERWGSASLLDLMAITLGEHLPEEIRDVLAERIKAHLTAHGLATELPSSPHYQSDGYWRGPIWAPASILIEDGLRRAGHHGIADEISSRFRALCEQSGFAENFDALTGAGLRDRAYTWTASSYLLLAEAHARRREDCGKTSTPSAVHV
jgi:hypothetical protein